MEANGFIGAAFRHRTSRAGDPQLHTHVVVPNLVQGADGRWSAPDGRHLYAWKKTAGTLYQSALRAELAPLGLRWQVRTQRARGGLRHPEGRFCGSSPSAGWISSRPWRQRGLTSSKAAEGAALATRDAEARTEGLTDVLREGWAEQLATIELPDGEGGLRPATTDDVTAALDAETPLSQPGAEATAAALGILAGENGVTLDDWEIDDADLPAAATGPGSRAMPVTLLGSTFTRREALMAVARAFDVTPDRASALTKALLERDDVVRVLADPEASGRARSGPGAGSVVPLTSGDRRYTTTELLAAEQRIIEFGDGTDRGADGRSGPSPGRPGPTTSPSPGRRTGRRGPASCSPRATATTWWSVRPARASRPCSRPPASAGRRPASGSSARLWRPGRPPTSKPVPASRARHSPTSWPT